MMQLLSEVLGEMGNGLAAVVILGALLLPALVVTIALVSWLRQFLSARKRSRQADEPAVASEQELAEEF